MTTINRAQTSILISIIFACISLPTSAQTLNACPNVTVGLLNSSDPAIYSDCTFENPDGVPGFHLTMSVDSGFVQVEANGWLAIELTPAPSGDIPFGRWDGVDLVLENMGSSYTGQCQDMVAPNPTQQRFIPAVDGDVYCYRVTNTEGNSVFIRGRLDIPGDNWLDPIVLNTQPGVGVPIASAVAVPVLPPILLLTLIILIGGLGLRKTLLQS